MSVLDESYRIDAEPGFIHVRHRRVEDSGHGSKIDMGGDLTFERTNLDWLVDTLRTCLTTYAFPRASLERGQDQLVVYESGPEQAPYINLRNRRPTGAPHQGIHIVVMSKPLAQNLLDDLARLLETPSP